jgi:proteasome lid subunit RPN8/RPN11|tara:strand:- start:264 stop:683 length:420 start_codon:yes stop_codon:yes gene_type:complete
MDLAMEETHNIKHPERALHKIKQICHENFRQEICGFLGFCPNSEKYIVKHERNISPDPSSYFLIDPLAYLLFKSEFEFIAVFHSHLTGDEKPSEFDIKMADNCCQAFLIYSLNTEKINIYEPQTTECDVSILERIKAIL